MGTLNSVYKCKHVTYFLKARNLFSKINNYGGVILVEKTEGDFIFFFKFIFIFPR